MSQSRPEQGWRLDLRPGGEGHRGAAHPPPPAAHGSLTLGGNALHEHVDDDDGARAADARAGERRGTLRGQGHTPRPPGRGQSSAPALPLLPLPPLPALTPHFWPVALPPAPEDPGSRPTSVLPTPLTSQTLGLSEASPSPSKGYIWSFFLQGFISLFVQSLTAGKGQPSDSRCRAHRSRGGALQQQAFPASPRLGKQGLEPQRPTCPQSCPFAGPVRLVPSLTNFKPRLSKNKPPSPTSFL